ncbi:hypothetical protein [Microcoleus sp. D3_18a_C4]|uniref:hypothetical protein n=1 Tax=Microcoleus sp. D3_18a_C4 TaxID=3055332 RepID=UPI002FD2E8E5
MLTKFTDRYEEQGIWSDDDFRCLSIMEKMMDTDAIVETLQFRCICDCQMYTKSDVKLALVRWFGGYIEHMVNDVYNVVEQNSEVFELNLQPNLYTET